MTGFLRLEYAALAVAILTGYHLAGGNWWLFAALILVPDVSMAFYLAGSRIGALAYNAVHNLVLAAGLWVAAILSGSELLVQLALILAAHIAIDRAFGYGLKLPSGFRDTHLGRIGK